MSPLVREMGDVGDLSGLRENKQTASRGTIQYIGASLSSR